MKLLTPASLTVIILLVVGGLVTAYVAKTLLAGEEPQVAERRNYPMAIADLEPGTVITQAHLALGPWPVTDEKSTFARTDSILIGRVVKNKLAAATPIDTLDLYPPGEFPPIDIAIGMRAVSIELGDGAAMLDGLVQAGEFVDIHFTPTGIDDDRFRGGFTMTLFEGVKVLAINRTGSSSRLNRGGNTVTLELGEKQANMLLIARQRGELNLVYTPDGRGDGGVAVADEDRAYLEEILGLKPREVQQPVVTEHYYRGGRSVRSFDSQTGSILPGSDDTRPNDMRQAPGQNPTPDPVASRQNTGMGSQAGDQSPVQRTANPLRLSPSSIAPGQYRPGIDHRTAAFGR